eukprot:2319964-Pleurochrysis_carterae.AAC.1
MCDPALLCFLLAQILGAMNGSRHISAFREEVQAWVRKLSTVVEVLELWAQVQAMWMHLEAVFSSADAAKQLPHESKRFAAIDRSWRKNMEKALETRNVFQFCLGNDRLQDLLPHLLEQLEVCQKALSGYLDSKRQGFPRFYFVSDHTLLELLSRGADGDAIQPHLPALFAGIARTDFESAEATNISSIVSAQGEALELPQHVAVENSIEDTLSRLETAMRAAVGAAVRQAVTETSVLPLEQFVWHNTAQASSLALLTKWTCDCDAAISRAQVGSH